MIVQFSCSVMSDSLQPHATMQQARPLCPSPTPKVYPNSYPLNWWCHPTISSSVVPFSSCCNLSQHQDLFKWVSSSHQEAKILEFQLQHHPSNKHPGLIPFSMDWLDLLAVQGTPRVPRVFSNTTVQKHQFCTQLSLYPTLTSIHDYWKEPKPWPDGPLLTK